MINSRWKGTKNAWYCTVGKSVTASTISALRMRTYLAYYEGIWSTGGIPPLVLNLNKRWRWVVSFTDWPINSQHPPNRRTAGPQMQSGHYRREKSLVQARNDSRIPLLSSPQSTHYSNYTKPAPQDEDTQNNNITTYSVYGMWSFSEYHKLHLFQNTVLRKIFECMETK
jgi:hypothetical protein